MKFIKVLDYLLSLGIGFLNMLLSYKAILIISGPNLWNLPYINSETITFANYWGYIIILSIILIPLVTIISAELTSKIPSNDEKNPLDYTTKSLAVTLVIPLFVAYAWLTHFLIPFIS